MNKKNLLQRDTWMLLTDPAGACGPRTGGGEFPRFTATSDSRSVGDPLLRATNAPVLRLAHRLVSTGACHPNVFGCGGGKDRRPDLEVHVLRNTGPAVSFP